MKKEKRISVGGQAVIEGVMMKGPKKTVLAVRNDKDEIIVNNMFENRKTRKIYKLPFIRGVYNFVTSMIEGYQSLSLSAELSGLDDLKEDNPTKFDDFMKKVFGDNLFKFVMYLSLVLGLALSVVLFMVIPTYVAKLINFLFANQISNTALTTIEGVVKLSIFASYLAIVSKMNDVKRVFQYHGAEHKAISCFENNMDLTVENVRKSTRFHPRCGTSFLLIVMLVSISVFLLPIFKWDNLMIRIVTKIAFLPLIASISYEIIKIASRYNNLLTRAISAPGLLLQRLTTKEPDDKQIEVAIASLKAVLPDSESKNEL